MATANFGTPNFDLPLIAIGMSDDEDQNDWAYEDGKVWSDECLDEFETYQEAVDYVKELKEKDNE